MKLTRRTMPEFEEAVREVMGRFDFELIYNGRNFIEPDGDNFKIVLKPFADHKPFYRGQK